MIEIEKVALP